MEGHTQIEIQPVPAELAEFPSVCTSLGQHVGYSNMANVYQRWINHYGAGAV